MDRLVRFAIALSLLLALAVGAVSQDESRHEQDSGVPQVQLEYVDDYESTRPSTHYAYDAMEGDMLVRTCFVDTQNPSVPRNPHSMPLVARSTKIADDVNLGSLCLSAERNGRDAVRKHRHRAG